MRLADNIMTGESVASKAAIFAFSIPSPCSLSAPITHPASSSSLLSLIILHHALADEALPQAAFFAALAFPPLIIPWYISMLLLLAELVWGPYNMKATGKRGFSGRLGIDVALSLVAICFLHLKKHGRLLHVCLTVLYKFHCLRKTCWEAEVRQSQCVACYFIWHMFQAGLPGKTKERTCKWRMHVRSLCMLVVHLAVHCSFSCCAICTPCNSFNLCALSCIEFYFGIHAAQTQLPQP